MQPEQELNAAVDAVRQKVTENELNRLQQAIGGYIQSQTQAVSQKANLITQEKKEELLERMACGHPKACLEVRGESGNKLGADAVYEMTDEEVRPVCIVCEKINE